MHFVSIILGCVLLGQTPSAAPPAFKAADPAPPPAFKAADAAPPPAFKAGDAAPARPAADPRTAPVPEKAAPAGAAAAVADGPEKITPPPLAPATPPDMGPRGERGAAVDVAPAARSPITPAVPAGPSAPAMGAGSGEGRPAAARLRLAPPEFVAEALSLPPGSALTGRPLSLLTVLSTVPDRRQQSDAVHDYWRLAETVAQYHFCLDRENQLARLQARPEEAAELRTARAASAATLREAELAVVAAQHELAAAMLLPPDSPLPLPADRPHVGAYRTYFAELFSMRPAPERARLIDRTLPLRQRAIEGHAAAAQAAEDALAATVDAQSSGEGRLAAALAGIQEHLGQRQALMASICRYNHDIADYALAVAAPNITGEALVAMLIRPSREVVPSAATAGEGGNQPASYQQPMLTPSGAPIQPGKNWPTRAVRPAAKPDSDPALPPSPAAPPAVRESRRPVSDEGAGAAPVSIAASAATYSSLVNLSAADRAKQLTAAMHQDRSLPQGTGRPMALEECLRSSLGADRRAVITAYWLARERTAQYLALVQQAQWLAELAPMLLDRRPDAAQAMLRLRTARLATEAEELDAHAGLTEAQFDLASRMGRAGESLWPLPTTLPYSGQYAAQTQSTARSWPLRRLEATIPGLGAGVFQRATAVVEADGARAAVTAAFQAGRQPLEDVLTGIHAQSEQTFAFLEALDGYNRAIAEYAVLTLPPTASPDALAAALATR